MNFLSPYFKANVIYKIDENNLKGIYLSFEEFRFYIMDGITNDKININNLQQIICTYPNTIWPSDIISSYKNLTMNIIKNNPNIPWEYSYISLNPNLTIEFINSHIDEDWDWNKIQKHPNIINNIDELNYPYIECHISDYINEIENNFWNVDWEKTTLNINFEYIKNNVNYPWDWKMLSMCTDLINIISNPDLEWNYQFIAKNINITSEFIDSNINKFTNDNIIGFDPNWIWFSKNPSITIDYIKNNLNKSWQWSDISKKINITMKVIEDNPTLRWNFSSIIENPNLTIKFIQKYSSTKIIEEIFPNSEYSEYFVNFFK